LRFAEAVSSALTRAVRSALTVTGEVAGVIPAAVVCDITQPSVQNPPRIKGVKAEEVPRGREDRQEGCEDVRNTHSHSRLEVVQDGERVDSRGAVDEVVRFLGRRGEARRGEERESEKQLVEEHGARCKLVRE
jgi:hypothetical protein